MGENDEVVTAGLTEEDGELVARISRAQWSAEGVPEPEDAECRKRAIPLVQRALGDLLMPDGVRSSPLGPGWSGDIDVYLKRPPEYDALSAHGWLDLDGLYRSLGRGSNGRWAVIERGQVLTTVDLHVGTPKDPLEGVLGRCRRIERVRLREVLELRVLLRAGEQLPDARAVRLAAALERRLGGDALASWRPSDRRAVEDRVAQRALWTRRALRRRKKRRLVLAISGVDGSGKSTLVSSVVDQLRRAGVPAVRIWARPGMGMRALKVAAELVKRVLRLPAQPAVRAIARGTSFAPARSRRGVIGWTWTMLVTLSYLWRARRALLRSEEVAIYDRHLLDALVTLDFVYGGAGGELHRRLLRAMLPAADLSFYLSLPAEVAIARKQSVVFGEHSVRQQLELYQRYRSSISSLVVLDATRPSEELAKALLHRLSEDGSQGP